MVTTSEFQNFLDAISDCFITPDFDAWRNSVELPFSLITRAGPVVLETPEHLYENFKLYLQACDAMGLDQIIRTPIDLVECPDGTWIGTYESNLLNNGYRVTTPYTASVLLIPTASGLKMSSILNARGHHEWTHQRPGPTRS
jgi:hypothetical protein